MTALSAVVEQYLASAVPIPLDLQGRQQWQAKFNVWPAMDRLGLDLDLSHPVACRLSIPELQPFHVGGAGDASQGGGRAVNGAIIAGMFDCSLGVAGVLQLLGRRAGTVDLSIKMFRPIRGPASAYAWAVRRSGSVVFTEALILDKNGVRCAHASGIVCAASSPDGAQRLETYTVSEPCAAY